MVIQAQPAYEIYVIVDSSYAIGEHSYAVGYPTMYLETPRCGFYFVTSLFCTSTQIATPNILCMLSKHQLLQMASILTVHMCMWCVYGETRIKPRSPPSHPPKKTILPRRPLARGVNTVTFTQIVLLLLYIYYKVKDQFVGN